MIAFDPTDKKNLCTECRTLPRSFTFQWNIVKAEKGPNDTYPQYTVLSPLKIQIAAVCLNWHHYTIVVDL